MSARSWDFVQVEKRLRTSWFIGDCSSASAGGRAAWGQPHLPSLLRRRTFRSQPESQAACCRRARPGPGRSESRCPLVAGFRSRPVRLRKAVSRAQHRRRCDTRMPGGDPGHLDLASSRRSRADDPHRTTRQTRNDFSDKTSNATLARSKDHKVEWHDITPGSRCKTLISRASTADARRAGQPKPLPRPPNARSAIAEWAEQPIHVA